jgi:hypothetical protein
MAPRRRGVAAATSMFHVKHWRMRRGKGGDALRMRSDGGGNKPRHLERAQRAARRSASKGGVEST